MKCFICNSDIENIHYNRDHQDFDPCPTCLEIIADVFSEEKDSLDPDEQIEITEEEVDLLLASWDDGIDVCS